MSASTLPSSNFYKVLLIVFLVHPFIWLFKRFSSRGGGGRWEIYGGAYVLGLLGPLGGDGKDSTLIAASNGSNAGLPPLLNPRIMETEHGLRKLKGYREGEWFREWETIKRCAAMRLQQEEPLKRAGDGYNNRTLDGY